MNEICEILQNSSNGLMCATAAVIGDLQHGCIFLVTQHVFQLSLVNRHFAKWSRRKNKEKWGKRDLGFILGHWHSALEITIGRSTNLNLILSVTSTSALNLFALHISQCAKPRLSANLKPRYYQLGCGHHPLPHWIPCQTMCTQSPVDVN